MSDNVSSAAIVAFNSLERGLQLNDLDDDSLLEIFRRLTLYDLMRVELVCDRWRILQRQVLREKTRLALVDDFAVNDGPVNSVATLQPCAHLTEGNLCKDILPIQTLHHLVSFLYFVAPRMPNVKTLLISIQWTVPEQLAQVLAKFYNVKCLSLYGKPTENAVEWSAVQKVLSCQYHELSHFVSNFHLAPEKKFDPMFADAISKLDACAYWLAAKIYIASEAAFKGNNIIYRAILKIESLLDVWFPRQTNGLLVNDAPNAEQNDDLVAEDAPLPPTPSLWRRSVSCVAWLFNWLSLFFSVFDSLMQKVFKRSKVTSDDLYFQYLFQLEELHIPGHFNRINTRSYTFSPSIGNTGLLKRLTLGDTKILHCCNSTLFQSLSFLDISDLWEPNYAYLYEKLTQCKQLSELRIHFICAQEESTLDLLDFLEEGCIKHSTCGFPQLSTLVLNFPLASLSRRYYLKFRYIFPAVSSISINFSRIKPERRVKLIYFMEHSRIGFSQLKTLRILSNGTADFNWLTSSHKIRIFNLSSMKLTRLGHLKAFLRIARYREDRASQGLGVNFRDITLELNSRQLAHVKARFIRMLATQGPCKSFEENLSVRTVDQPFVLTMMYGLSARSIETN